MALPAELMQNVPTIDEFWAAFTKSQEKAAKEREEWDRRIAEAEEEVKRNKAEWLAAHREAERTVDRVGKQMGDLNNRFGELAEHLAAPGIVRRFNELGYHFGDAMIGRMKIHLRPYEFVVLKDRGKYEAAKVRYL